MFSLVARHVHQYMPVDRILSLLSGNFDLNHTIVELGHTLNERFY